MAPPETFFIAIALLKSLFIEVTPPFLVGPFLDLLHHTATSQPFRG